MKPVEKSLLNFVKKFSHLKEDMKGINENTVEYTTDLAETMKKIRELLLNMASDKIATPIKNVQEGSREYLYTISREGIGIQGTYYTNSRAIRDEELLELLLNKVAVRKLSKYIKNKEKKKRFVKLSELFRRHLIKLVFTKTKTRIRIRECSGNYDGVVYDNLTYNNEKSNSLEGYLCINRLHLSFVRSLKDVNSYRKEVDIVLDSFNSFKDVIFVEDNIDKITRLIRRHNVHSKNASSSVKKLYTVLRDEFASFFLLNSLKESN